MTITDIKFRKITMLRGMYEFRIIAER